MTPESILKSMTDGTMRNLTAHLSVDEKEAVAQFLTSRKLGAVDQPQTTLIPSRPAISSILVKPASADCNLHCTYCFYHDRATDSLNQALNWIDQGRAEKRPVSVGLLANGAAAARELLRLRKIPDIVTDQTSAHNLMDYVPEGGEYDALMALRQRQPKKYRERSLATLVDK